MVAPSRTCNFKDQVIKNSCAQRVQERPNMWNMRNGQPKGMEPSRTLFRFVACHQRTMMAFGRRAARAVPRIPTRLIVLCPRPMGVQCGGRAYWPNMRDKASKTRPPKTMKPRMTMRGPLRQLHGSQTCGITTRGWRAGRAARRAYRHLRAGCAPMARAREGKGKSTHRSRTWRWAPWAPPWCAS